MAQETHAVAGALETAVADLPGNPADDAVHVAADHTGHRFDGGESGAQRGSLPS